METRKVGYTPDVPDVPHKDVKGNPILPGARVVYGDWGHRVWTGTVREYRMGNILIDPDVGTGKGLWRLVQGRNSKSMILCL